MAIVVEHDKRKTEILEKSLELFCKEGYEDVTFQKIADACGITRTTLYIYFKNKREIFIWSIKQLTENVELQLREILKDKSLSSGQSLQKMMDCIIDMCTENRQLFTILLFYLTNLQKSGVDPEERVNRRIIRAKHLLTMIIIRGQKSGEFKKVPIKKINDLFFNLIEASIFEIAVLNKKDISSIKGSVEMAVSGILAV